MHSHRSITRLAATSLLLLAFALPSLAADTADSLFRAGQQALMSNQIDRAAELLEKAIAMNGRVAEYHYWLGSAYGRQAQKASMFSQIGLAKKTREEFELTVKLDPKHQDGRFGLLEFYLIAPGFMGGGEDKAIAQANELKKQDALAGHRAWSRIYFTQKKPDLARKEMLDAVREQPDSPKAHYYLALSFMAEKNYPKALESFENSVRHDATFTPAWFRIGQCSALAAQSLPRGEEMLRKYLATKPAIDEPPLARAWYWLGMIQEKQGHKAEAKASYQNSLKLTAGAKDVTEALKRVS
jgi:tetratricopeptide (TPR) repeat protein